MRNAGNLVVAFATVSTIPFDVAEGGLVSGSRQVISNALASVGQDGAALKSDVLEPVFRLGLSAVSTAVVIYAISLAVYKALQAFDRESQESAAREIRKRAWSRVSMLEISEDSLPSYSRSLGFGGKTSRSSESSFEPHLTRKALHSSPAIETPFLGAKPL